VEALEEYGRHYPLSASLAVATLKKYLADDVHRIRLHDLAMRVMEDLYEAMSPDEFPTGQPSYSDDELQRRVGRYEAATEVAANVMAVGCFWGRESAERLWAKALERIANPPGESGGLQAWVNLRSYPAIILLYAGGIASVAAGRYGTLSSLLRLAMVEDYTEEKPLALSLGPVAAMQGLFKRLPGQKARHTPLSDHLFRVLREPLRPYLPRDKSYEACFDRFEYLMALVVVDSRLKLDPPKSVRGPVGRFGWRNRDYPERTVMREIDTEFSRTGAEWAPLKQGLFELAVDDFRMMKDSFDAQVERLEWY
jgi:hypothetical protein